MVTQLDHKVFNESSLPENQRGRARAQTYSQRRSPWTASYLILI